MLSSPRGPLLLFDLLLRDVTPEARAAALTKILAPDHHGDEQQATDKRQAGRAQEVILDPKADKPGADGEADGENQGVADQNEGNQGLAREPGVGVDRVGESEDESIGDGEAQQERSKG